MLPFELVLADKKTNSEGLQFADLVARPVGLSVVRPGRKQMVCSSCRERAVSDSAGAAGPANPVLVLKRSSL